MGNIWPEEHRRSGIEYLFEDVIKRIPKDVPEHLRFFPICNIAMHVNCAEEMKVYIGSHMGQNGRECYIKLSSSIAGEYLDRSSYVFFGTKEQVLAWFQDPKHVEEAEEVFRQLREGYDGDGGI